jgi:hypothetical protein
VNRYTRRVALGGAHDGFPAFEIYHIPSDLVVDRWDS